MIACIGRFLIIRFLLEMKLIKMFLNWFDLNLKELRVALNAIGKRYSEADVAKALAMMDTDGNGKVLYFIMIQNTYSGWFYL